MDDFIPGFDDLDDDISGYYDEDSTKLNPELILKPALCLLCANDDNPQELVMCDMNRLDQADEDDEFICGAYKPKKGTK